MVILWIDPGTTTVWYSLVEKIGWKITLLDYGVFTTTPKIDLEIKLLEIWSDISFLIEKYNPDIVSIEKLFFQNNSKTAIDVAHARWVIVYESIKKWKKILHYTPLQVKKAITWNGKSNKLQLQNAIKILFWLDNIPKPDDAADAIWLAYMWALNLNCLIEDVLKK